MRTFALQRVPDGFALDAPPFGYWMKAGAAFTLGAGAVYLAAILARVALLSIAPGLWLAARLAGL